MKDNNQSKEEKLLMMICILQGENPSAMYDGVDKKLNFLFDKEVAGCAYELCLLLINWFNEGLSYEEIEEQIENLDLENLKKLTEENQKNIKEEINGILVRRRQMKGND